MAAPSGIIWGSIVGSYGRIGIYVSTSSTNTATTVAVEVWFASKYSVSDTSNTLYYDDLSYSGSASTSKGAVSIKTTGNSGSGWSTSNEVKLASYSATYTRITSSQTRYLYAKLANVDRVGGTMYASTTVTIPKLESYTVSYDANGGSNAPSSQTKWYGNSITLSSTKPTRTGYTFSGWATSSSGSVAYAAGATYSSNASITLYAKWTANTYTVSYDANGGSGAPSSQKKTYGVALTLSSAKPTRSGYTFNGWGTSASATTVSYLAGGNYTNNSDVTLYAIWTLAYIKPTISSASVYRCNSSGTSTESGTYVKVSVKWVTYNTATKYTIVINSTTTTGTLSGTSGTTTVTVGAGKIATDSSYAVSITIADSGGSTTVQRTVPSIKFPIDIKAGGGGVAFGKSAENDNLAEFGWRAQVYHDDLGFVHKHTTSSATIGFGVGNGGVNKGLYDVTNGAWMCKWTDEQFGLWHPKTNIMYRPYFSAGDSFTAYYSGAGYCNDSKQVSFVLFLAKPILGSPTVTISTSSAGYTLRQNGLYTHGSSASASVKPSTTNGALYTGDSGSGYNSIRILATFTSTTNATANDAIGIYAGLTITLS